MSQSDLTPIQQFFLDLANDPNGNSRVIAALRACGLLDDYLQAVQDGCISV